MKRISMALLLTACFFSVVHAHEGEDHGVDVTPVTGDVAPRTHAASDDFELVAVLRDGKLIVYLDAYATNEPITNAQVDLDAGGVTAKGVANDDGTYQFAIPALTTPGKHPLVFTVQAGDRADLLNATLNVDDRNVATKVVWPLWQWALMILIGALLLGIAAWLVRRLRLKKGGFRHA